MREGTGLYKAKRKDTGKWIQGYLFCIWEKAYILWGTINGIPDMVEVNPDTVCEGTGLVDKNEVQIFEGDIVDILTENEETGVVTFEDGCFVVSADGFCVNFYDNINGEDVEVIGSIHDKAVEE